MSTMFVTNKSIFSLRKDSSPRLLKSVLHNCLVTDPISCSHSQNQCELTNRYCCCLSLLSVFLNLLHASLFNKGNCNKSSFSGTVKRNGSALHQQWWDRLAFEAWHEPQFEKNPNLPFGNFCDNILFSHLTHLIFARNASMINLINFT